MTAGSGLDGVLTRSWQRRGIIAWLLSPLAVVYGGAMGLRGFAYRHGFIRQHRFEQPVIVVGNLTVGGTGKTPLVAEIARFFKNSGFKPGIITRGYGGKTEDWPKLVTTGAKAEDVGDEALVLARQTQCAVMVDPDRPRGVRELIDTHQCDVIVSDDGLQHLALGRRVEIVVVDGEKEFGNGFYLPAGPLRESKSKLDRVDFVVYNGNAAHPEQWSMAVELLPAVKLIPGAESKPLEAFSGLDIHAVAGVGNPQRFFRGLRQIGLSISEHPFPDHVIYRASDFALKGENPILMTEKDAVKCKEFASDRMWFVPMRAELDAKFYERLLKRISHD